MSTRWKTNKRLAFTLIELLIVVAIIAVLAAIAVPNFLEAQLRAKISRAKSDMRSIAVALESYCVDNNEYPVIDLNADKSAFPNNSGKWAGYLKTTITPPSTILPAMCLVLTTPVAYITTPPVDPFDQTDGLLDAADTKTRHGKGFSYWFVNFKGAARDPLVAPNFGVTASAYANPGYGLLSPAPLAFTGWGSQKPFIITTNWFLFSAGPDKKVGTPMADGTAGVFEPHNVFYSDIHWQQVTGQRWNQRLMFYDPTNGSTSAGDLWYFGGSQPR